MSEDVLGVVEEVGYTFHQFGMGRMESRVLGWLLLCDPPEQNAAQIAAALRASRGSISMAMRSLLLGGLVERVPRPGDRRDYYRFPPDAWESVFMDQRRRLVGFQQVVERGLAVMAGAPTARAERLQRLNDLFEWYAEEFPRFMDSWRAFRDVRRQERERERARGRDKEHDDG